MLILKWFFRMFSPTKKAEGKENESSLLISIADCYFDEKAGKYIIIEHPLPQNQSVKGVQVKPL